MPEGPSILILKESILPFKNKKVLKVSGNSKLDLKRLENKKVLDIKTWGKQLLICFKDVTVRIHLLMFGSYRINERKEAQPRLSLAFKKGEINFYSCSVKLIEDDINKIYDWTADVLSPLWNSKNAEAKLNAIKDQLICDALLNQEIFAGVGNIIKNEILFRTKIHPESIVGKIPVVRLRKLIKDAVVYSFLFLEWKKKYELKKHWQAHTKKICPRDHIPFKKSYLGKTHRRSFYCNECQELFT